MMSINLKTRSEKVSEQQRKAETSHMQSMDWQGKSIDTTCSYTSSFSQLFRIHGALFQGKYLVVDLQGAVDNRCMMLTDPQVQNSEPGQMEPPNSILLVWFQTL